MYIYPGIVSFVRYDFDELTVWAGTELDYGLLKIWLQIDKYEYSPVTIDVQGSS